MNIDIKIIDKSEKFKSLSRKYFKQYGQNPDLYDAMARMWGFDSADHFYSVKKAHTLNETLADIKKGSVKAEYLQTPRGIWLVAFNWMAMTQGGGYSIHPSEFIAFSTKDDARQYVALAALKSFQALIDRADSVTTASEKEAASKIQKCLYEHLNGQLSLF